MSNQLPKKYFKHDIKTFFSSHLSISCISFTVSTCSFTSNLMKCVSSTLKTTKSKLSFIRWYFFPSFNSFSISCLAFYGILKYQNRSFCGFLRKIISHETQITRPLKMIESNEAWYWWYRIIWVLSMKSKRYHWKTIATWENNYQTNKITVFFGKIILIIIE